ncbi:MAG TPA: hypothetical protein VFZ17_06940 [Acidimicrobiia bacterium]|nr:hypothetical protein [Acidimicrobiia bacterium]
MSTGRRTAPRHWIPRGASLGALVATITILGALATPALDAQTRHPTPIGGVGRQASGRDAVHPASSTARTTSRVGPGAAVLPLLAVAFALAVVATLRAVRRRRSHVTTWRFEWSRGPPLATCTASAATFA